MSLNCCADGMNTGANPLESLKCFQYKYKKDRKNNIFHLSKYTKATYFMLGLDLHSSNVDRTLTKHKIIQQFYEASSGTAKINTKLGNPSDQTTLHHHFTVFVCIHNIN
jgi:hypothetical protein